MAKADEPYVELQALLGEAARGDKEALGRLLERHRGYLRALALRRIGSELDARLDASDLIQQTCLSGYRNFAAFQGRSLREFVVWLQRIHDRNMNDAIREHHQAARRAVGREAVMVDGWEREIAASGESSPSARAMANEDAVILTLALEDLPFEQREAVRLRHIEGRPLAEIADRLGRSEDAIGGLLKRGLQALRRRFQADRRGEP
jgi:RNA polymerase sigma-70 factor, ECF subfamily